MILMNIFFYFDLSCQQCTPKPKPQTSLGKKTLMSQETFIIVMAPTMQGANMIMAARLQILGRVTGNR